MFEDIEKIKADLVFALKPIWKLPKEQQVQILEPFINELMGKAKAIHDDAPTLEKV
jgi:hypothetical protein